MAGGTKYDQEKTRWDLLNPGFLAGIADVMTFGAKKYDSWNWAKGISYSRCFAALMRHLWAWYGGERNDPETGLSHLYHAGCCLMFLASYEEWERRDLDDRAIPTFKERVVNDPYPSDSSGTSDFILDND